MGHRTGCEEIEESLMKKTILCLLAVGMVGFGGCSSRTKTLNAPDFPGITGDDYATGYMLREFRLYGAAIADPIQINGVQLFQIGNGDCVTFKIPTGQSEVIFVPQWKRLKFASEKGKKYYFYLRVEAGQAGADFRQLTKEEWNEKQKACNWVELKKEKGDIF
jgi:hypothetical protein